MPTFTGGAPPASLWSKEATPPSESSPLVPGEGPGWNRFASPLPRIPVRYSWFKARRGGLICTIFLLYLAVLSKSMGDAALYATLPSVRAATGFAGVLTNLPAAGTAAYGVGKAIGIITASHMGGRITLIVGLVGGMMLLLFADGRYSVMLTTWCIFRFATSQTWGGFTMIVANWVDGADVGKVMGVLAIAWELGTGGAEAIFGLMLGNHGVDHWREPFYVGGVFNIVALMAIFFFLHGSATSAGYRPPLLKHESEGAAHPLQQSSVQVALQYFSRSGRFWLILVSNCCILAAMYTLFFMNVYAVKALGASDQQGAFLLTYISMGTLVAIVIATMIYDGLSKLQRAIMLSVSNFCFLSFTVISFSVHVSGHMTTQLLAALGSLTAFFGGMGAYLPISIFQIQFGGPRHASTMSNLHDTFGIGLSTYASYLAGNYVEEGQYTHYWALFTINVMIATVALVAFGWADFYHERKALRIRAESEQILPGK